MSSLVMLRDRLLPARIAAWRDAIDTISADYRRLTGRKLDLRHPRRFSEKMQWRKLFDLNPAFALFSDKHATRAYVSECLGPGHLPELFWFGRDADAAPIESLPTPYVLKSSHGYGQVEIVEAGATAEVARLRAAAREWLVYNHGSRKFEPGYEHVEPGLMIEELLADDSGRPPDERKIFCFGGRARIIQTITVEPGSRARTTSYHTTDWTRLDWRSLREPYPGELPRPERLAEMLAAAETLSRGFDHLRVDLYDCGATFRVGELTVYSWSGFCRFKPDSVDEILGDYWPLPFPSARAVLTVLFRRRAIRPRRSRGKADGGGPSAGQS